MNRRFRAHHVAGLGRGEAAGAAPSAPIWVATHNLTGRDLPDGFVPIQYPRPPAIAGAPGGRFPEVEVSPEVLKSLNLTLAGGPAPWTSDR